MDFTTGSRALYAPTTELAQINVASYDAAKQGALTVVGDARAVLEALSSRLSGHTASPAWPTAVARWKSAWDADWEAATAAPSGNALPSDAQVIGAVWRTIGASGVVVCAAGGLPGELHRLWRSRASGDYHLEYGFSCMGYEISGGWGAAMARQGEGGSGEVVVLVGDGSYLMANSDLYSSVLSGHRMIVVVCDNGGYAVIERLQLAQGGTSFNNMIATSRVVSPVRVDFAAHAASLGCNVETVEDVEALELALRRARDADRTTVIAIRTDPEAWSAGGAFWEVGVPEVSSRSEVNTARTSMDLAKSAQRMRG
jgi:3D-(3,5/4)-trihydroxycyclohexane-1,2-dione acylhydrolase (decyclizing)